MSRLKTCFECEHIELFGGDAEELMSRDLCRCEIMPRPRKVFRPRVCNKFRYAGVEWIGYYRMFYKGHIPERFKSESVVEEVE